jgi:hypothetical protein
VTPTIATFVGIPEGLCGWLDNYATTRIALVYS